MKKDSQHVSISLSKQLTVFLAALSFVVPFLLSQSQIPTGIFVNALLFLSVLFLPASTRLPIIIFPSLATVTRGLVFGGLTPFLLAMVPVIWLGNWLLTMVFDKLHGRLGLMVSGVIASLTKVTVLFLTAIIFVRLGIVPKLFLTVMGNVQLITALAGFVVALGVYHIVSSRRV
ncbi:MAG: hypothetical protein V1917_00030 [Candidatus Gottesmanbacteria bacterium]